MQIREMQSIIEEDTSKWKMIVVDYDGKSIYEVGFDLKPIGWL